MKMDIFLKGRVYGENHSELGSKENCSLTVIFVICLLIFCLALLLALYNGVRFVIPKCGDRKPQIWGFYLISTAVYTCQVLEFSFVLIEGPTYYRQTHEFTLEIAPSRVFLFCIISD